MLRSTLILCLGALALGATLSRDPATTLVEYRDTESFPIVSYDGPLYKMSPAEYQNMTDAMENGTEWFVPDEVPRVEWTPGTVLDFGGDGSNSLQARGGAHQLDVYSNRGCDPAYAVGGVYNFGCGGVCVYYKLPLYSALLRQQSSGNPKPTASMFPNQSCSGSSRQSIGIQKGQLSGCTNANTCCGSWFSFYAYYNC
ncbi:hypothetical protein NQ176_g6174 [Zarea fungicola]|uniref:Uncharacterized protein n=1 Tax=Zarea fungicola TaxID=93591 RepID=A0ACC1N555_9HYPO|nr:hypothetical protein NQ176_g6174 [Lecanicillium fungicola]